MTNELDLHEWLKTWISSAPEENVRKKFLEISGLLSQDDIVYVFYRSIVKEHPDKQKEIDFLIELPW